MTETNVEHNTGTASLQPVAQHPRMELSPLQTAKPSTLHLSSLKPILLVDLLEEDKEIEVSNLKYINLQLLRIITYD